MRNRRTLSVLPVVAGFLAAFALPVVAQNRLPQAIPASASRVAIPNTVLPRAKAATDLGLAPADTQLSAITLRFNQTAGQTAALATLLFAQQNSSSPRFHQWLTPEQFAASFGVSAADAATVSTWLQAQGFSGVSLARSRTFISFSGTAAQVNQGFGVAIHSVSSQGEQHVSNLADPTLPAAIANIVTGVTGLNDLRLKPHARPRYNGGSNYGNLIAPGDLYTIYNSKPLIADSITGSGIKLAVVGQTDISLSDVTAFRTAASLSTNLPTVVLAGTDPGTSKDDVDEAMIDVEWSGASAPSATIVYVNGQDVFNNSMTYAIDEDVAPIISVSYGGCETEFGSAALNAYNGLFAEANAQGQTVVGPSGDSGAADCDYETTYAKQGLAVDFPASSPYVTGVGGSEFNEGSGTYWSTTDGANAGTALSYIPEQPWNETFLTTSRGALFGLEDGGSGGGGASVVFTKPAWQVGTVSDSARDVPDVSLNGAADHDGYLICSEGSCANGFAGALTNGSIYGGTSVATPAFAGMLALLEQKLQVSGLGNVNPTLYGLANSTYSSTVFNDITSGNNAVPCQAGTTDCSAGSPGYHAANTIACPANSCSGNVTIPSLGYLATTGYDLASGWGSVNAANMVADWLLVTPTGGTTTPTLYASVTSAATSTPSVTAGASVTVNATVASGSTASTTVPTGTVQLSVDGTSEGASVTLASGAASLPAFSTTNLSAGTHTFTVTYSGDGVYAASSGSVTITVAAATSATADFTLTPASTSVTVAAGGATSGLTFKVTPAGGFTGSVAFTVTGLPTASTSSLSANPVAITTTTAGTTVLTIQAYTAAAALAPRQTPWVLGGSGLAFAGLLLCILPRRRRRWSGLLVAIVSIGILSAAGCGSGGTTTSNSNNNAAAGTYTVTLTATSGSLAHTAAVTLVVQ